jgi:hypothetical protein
MSWARMVVVAVRDPATGHPAARLARRLLLTAGFAFAAWLAGLVLGTFTASAEEVVPSPTQDGQVLPESQLAAALAGTLGGLNGLTHLTALTGTVEHIAAQVTETALAVAPRPDGAAGPPAVGRSDPRSQDPSAPINHEIPQPTARLTAAPAPAPPAVATPQRRAPEARAHPIVQAGARPSAPPREAAPRAVSQQAGGDTPVPAPGRSNDHTAGVGAPHDGGGGKQPFVVPGARPGAADRVPAGPVTRGKGLAPARKAALPTTSPD